MQARLVASRPPWWVGLAPWGMALAAAYLLVSLSSSPDWGLLALAYGAALTAAMLVLVPSSTKPRVVELALSSRSVRILGAPLHTSLDQDDVRAVRVNERPGFAEIVIDLGQGAPVVLEVSDAEDARAVVAALGGARVMSERVTFPTSAMPGRREARALALMSLALLAVSLVAGALGALEASVLLASGVFASLYATVRALTSPGGPTVELDPRALHTDRARIPVETITRVEETENAIRVTTDGHGVKVLPITTGRLHGDVSAESRALLARSIACAADEARPGPTTDEPPLASHLRRGARTARQWLADLDAFAVTAGGEHYRVPVGIDELSRIATDDRSDEEIRLAAARVLYRVAPEVPETLDSAYFQRVATEDERKALAAFADLERRRTWR